MKTTQILAACAVAFALNTAPSYAAVSAATTFVQGERTIAEEASAIVTRIERSFGGLNNGQRDAIRQGAETYARDRRTAQQTNNAQLLAGAIAQFDNLVKQQLTAEQFATYQNNRDFYLNGRGGGQGRLVKPGMRRGQR